MTDLLKNALCCPLCGSSFELGNDGKSLICNGEKRHCYDFSSSGYINFAPPSQSRSGDSKESVRSRTEFLNRGFYAPIRDAVKDTVKCCADGLVIDAGSGEGYYSSALSEVAKGVIGFDLSKFGVETAAKRVRGVQNIFFGVASIYTMPLTDACAQGIVSIFAPGANEEFARVLKKDGVLIVVGAGKRHLIGLKEAIYDTTYENTEREDMPDFMELTEEKQVLYEITLKSKKEIFDLFSMTPYYYRTSESDMEKLNRMENLNTFVDVLIRIYHKK